METAWSHEHRQEFEAELHRLHAARDAEGVYRAWIREITLNPDHYENYPDVMLYVLRNRLFDEEKLKKMISLADHAESFCSNDDIRNEIWRIMLRLSYECGNAALREKTAYYYGKLPMLRHSREIHARYVMEGEEYRTQLKKNLIYLVDLAECTVRQLITPDISDDESIYYRRRAIALLDAVIDGHYAGFYDPPLISNHLSLARLFAKKGNLAEAEAEVLCALGILERHIGKEKTPPPLLSTTAPPNVTPAEILCRKLLDGAAHAPELAPFHPMITALRKRFLAHFFPHEA